MANQLVSHTFHCEIVFTRLRKRTHNRIFVLVDNIRNHLASIQLASHKCEKESEKNISKAVESIVEFVNYIEKNWKELERIKEEQKLN